jgi:hypothetical protein
MAGTYKDGKMTNTFALRKMLETNTIYTWACQGLDWKDLNF